MAFNENSGVKIPALLHLIRLGYAYVPLQDQFNNKKQYLKKLLS